MQIDQSAKQETGACDWCGKFVALIVPTTGASPPLKKRLYDLYVDEAGRLVRDENDMFYTSGEHRCKVACSGCGRLVVIEGGMLYEKSMELSATVRTPHRC